VAASFEGNETAIAFNPHYLLDGLTAAAAGSGPARPPADQEEGAPAPAAATIRLEFTSPAKPALITLAGDGGHEPAGTEGTGGEGAGAVPPFRYLVVPLRSPTRA
jgi:DNA polymerase III sliding clamp (beta) subunit (PCNA family)